MKKFRGDANESSTEVPCESDLMNIGAQVQASSGSQGPPISYINAESVSLFDTTYPSYDTLRIVYRGPDKPKNRYLTLVREIHRPTSDKVTTLGKYGNLDIGITFNELKLKGSFPGFVHRNNVLPITLKKLQEVVQELSDLFEVNITQSLVKRLDIACTLSMSNAPWEYLNLLIRTARFDQWNRRGEGVLFRNNMTSLSFYDKSKETGQVLHSPFLLRYELQLKEISKRHRFSNLTVTDILKPDTYRKLCGLWLKEFDHIPYRKDLSSLLRLAPNGNPMDVIILQGISAFGGIDVVARYFKGLQYSGLIDKQKRFRDLKKLRNILGKVPSSSHDDLMKELSTRIHQAAEYGIQVNQ